MRPETHNNLNGLISLPRSAKKILAIMADSALCVLTVWLAICLRFESWISLSGYHWLAVILSVALAIPLLTAFGFYHTVIRFVGRQTINSALRAVGIYAVIYSAVFTAYGFPLVPRSIGVLQPLLLLIGLGLLRLSANQLLGEHTDKHNHHLTGVLIYGAGSSGQQLAHSITAKGESRVVAFIDDDTNLHQASIGGIPVHGTADLSKLCSGQSVRDVLLAMPNLDRSRRNQVIEMLSSHRIAIRTLPSLSDLAQGKIDEGSLRELNIEDLLGRDAVAPIPELLTKNIQHKTVLVTGAGGSIGSELCRQIVEQSPKHLILLDVSEHALYLINEELSLIAQKKSFALTCLLANILDASLITKLFKQYQPHTIYHAAAYKHVPLVESNPYAGLRNNILGTVHVAQAALTARCADMVFISTDKAVRPTNIMGASKRLAELALQKIANQQKNQHTSTRFCLVRFGNVLGSSGSVVPKFRQQIKSGGPLTITHPEVTRYFMTTQEAAQLVIQAGAMHQTHNAGLKVYLLDMGSSVKIIDLARTMIRLSGLKEREPKADENGIEIVFTGLRPGEKLFEELLIEGSPLATAHPKILTAQDVDSEDDLTSVFKMLSAEDQPLARHHILKLLAELPLGFTPDERPMDAYGSAW